MSVVSGSARWSDNAAICFLSSGLVIRPESTTESSIDQPGRIEMATRLAVICALIVLVVEIYQTPDQALSVYLVFFLNRDDRTVSLIINFLLIALVTVIIGFVLLIAMVVMMRYGESSARPRSRLPFSSSPRPVNCLRSAARSRSSSPTRSICWGQRHWGLARWPHAACFMRGYPSRSRSAFP